MIVCKLNHLLARCRERGYEFDQVKACIVDEQGDYITVDETHPAYPHYRPGLGDYVAKGLSAIGITKKRVSKVLGKPCGCGKRQQKLNELGRKFGIG